MENEPFEDVFPIEMGIFDCHVSLLEGTHLDFFFANDICKSSHPCIVPGGAHIFGLGYIYI